LILITILTAISNCHQHSQFFFSPFPFTSLLSILMLLVGLAVSLWSSRYLMGLPIVVKI
jgi:hypothetical protein